LPVQISPFAQTIEVQEVLQAGFADLALRERVFQVMVKVPQLQIAEKV